MIEGKANIENTGTVTYGMVGGGPGAFIGDVHRKAAAFDGKAQLVAGSFSSHYEKTVEAGKQLGIQPERLYRDYHEMAKEEAARQDGIDFVVIVAPNLIHYDAAKAFLQNGIHVVCEKPLAFTVDQAEELAALAREKKLLFCVTYAYSNYPAVKQAQMMVKNGDIGEIRMVMGEYPQGWLAHPAEEEGSKQAGWRTDPAQAGISNCVGDIGSHIENTVSYITGLEIEEICARLDNFGGSDRPLDTNAIIMLRYKNGAVGNYWCSQVAIGYDNALTVRIFGSKGSIEWRQEAPNYLETVQLGGPVQRLSRGNGYFYPEAEGMSRIPAGHPEGYHEAFANTYLRFTAALLKLKQGLPLNEQDLDFPNAWDGVRGVKFIHRCVESSKQGARWVKFD